MPASSTVPDSAGLADAWPSFMAAVADTDQPRAAFAALETLTKAHVGTTLFTATAVEGERVRRVYSENEAAYPTGGYKPMARGAWSEQVIDRREPFASLTIEGIATVFPDWPLIQSLGAGSNCNIPVVVGDAVIGTVNLLHETGWYTPERVARAMELQPFATLAFTTLAFLTAERAR